MSLFKGIQPSNFVSLNKSNMKIEQIYTGCLAQGAYYIESNGEVAIIDPLRETDSYIERAEKDGAKIKYILETHFHADFVSGHLDLYAKTGANIVYGPTAKPNFDAHITTDNELLKLGNISIKVLHTPGHTMESTCYLLIDENGKEVACFTGDTLFIGDVGRPDLAQKGDITQEVLAGYLFDSLRNKIMVLYDEVIIYPGHGAGSACGKKMSTETTDTLGQQKKFNYALRESMTRENFIKEVTDGLVPPPAYFPENVRLNKQGYESFEVVKNRGLKSLNPEAFELVANEVEALILDTRNAEEFTKGFIPNSINIGIDGSFAQWAGALIPDIKQAILIITPKGREEEVITRLARVGYDNTIGYLEGGFEAWLHAHKELDGIDCIDAEQLAYMLDKSSDIEVVDVRKISEYDTQHYAEAIHAPLDFVNDSMIKLNKEKPYYVHCAAGYRSVIFISILKARGYKHLINVTGGFNAMKASGKFKLSEFAVQQTDL